MSGFKLNEEAKKAIKIGSLCSVSYLAVYIARNILGAVSPQMIESGEFTTEGIGLMSSVYFVTYALGQLVNGAIGDRIKAKYMISFGLILAGISNGLLAISSASRLSSVSAYGAAGFFLSMIYGPMTKVVAENTKPVYTTRCSLGYTVASFLGTPLAGVLAAVMVWQAVFLTGSAALLIMGIISFAVFTYFEKKGVVQYGKYKKEKEKGSLSVLLKHRIVKWTAIAFLTGVVRTTVVFWMPTYLNQYLSIPSDKAAVIFTVVGFVLTTGSFSAVYVYEKLGHSEDKTVLLGFSLAAVFFGAIFFIKIPVINTVFLTAAIYCSNWAANMLYARYCPSLRDTGMVSSATGFLDFISYISASAASTVFANAVSRIGWKGLTLVWFGLMVAGILVALPKRATQIA